MPRRYRPEKRAVEPDLRYNSTNISMVVNRLMRGGKKSVAQRVLYQSFDIIEERTNRNPLEVFEQALSNARPQVEVKPRRCARTKRGWRGSTSWRAGAIGSSSIAGIGSRSWSIRRASARSSS
jgi:hypothetical protein